VTVARDARMIVLCGAPRKRGSQRNARLAINHSTNTVIDQRHVPTFQQSYANFRICTTDHHRA
jgi:hypothetical protein